MSTTVSLMRIAPLAMAALRRSAAKLGGSNQPSPDCPKPAAATPSVASQGKRACKLLGARAARCRRPCDCCSATLSASSVAAHVAGHDQVALLAKGHVGVGAEQGLEAAEHGERRQRHGDVLRRRELLPDAAGRARRAGLAITPYRARSGRCGGCGMLHPCSESRRPRCRRSRRQRSRHLRFPRPASDWLGFPGQLWRNHPAMPSAVEAIALAVGTAFA